MSQTRIPITGELILDGEFPEGVSIVGGMHLGLNLAITRPSSPGGGGEPPSLVFAEDSFTDTAGTLLENHTPELGGPWVENTATLSGQGVITDAGRLRSGNTNTGLYLASTLPASPDYSVFGEFVALSSSSAYAGIAARVLPTSLSGYIIVMRPHASWELRRYKIGGYDSLGTITPTPTVGVVYAVELRLAGSSIKVFINEVEKLSVTNTVYPNAGSAGVYAGNNTASNTTGAHLDNFQAVNV